MNTAIIIVIVVVAVVLGAALFVFLPRGGHGYARRMDKRLREENSIMDPEPPERPERPRPIRIRPSQGETAPLMPVIITTLRAVIGLAAVAVLAFIFNSTGNAAAAATDTALKTSLYTEGIFNAVVTIGIAVGLYLFTKFSK
jgi:hypothetical protein